MSATVAELVLDAESDAVPRARRFVLDLLDAASSDLRDDAELVVAELVTNAVLHGAPPVTLRIQRLADAIRIEVEDRGQRRPLVMRSADDAMTGRGLALVGRLARGWGVDPADAGGKAVWAEVGDCAAAGDPGPDADADVDGFDVDALLAAWDDEPADGERFTVELGAVPTDLLLEAKAHIDNLVREFILAESAADLPGGPGLSRELAALVQTVVHGFADARAQIKQQAVAAAARGARVTDLRLTLAPSAADAGERYLAALDDADRYARTARLLTLETPPVHRLFRQWYVTAIVDRLRHAAADGSPAATTTFQERLQAEVAELSPLREVAQRLQLLQQVTADLTGAPTVESIVSLVCDRAHDVLGALSARIYLLTEDGTLRSAATTGGDARLAQMYDELPVDADLPGGEALRTEQPVVVRSIAELAARFPQLAKVYQPHERTLLVAPLVVGDHRLGVLSLTFHGEGAVDERTQLTFLTTVADVTAQALERATAAAAAAAAAERLAFLAEASVLLSSSLDYRAVLEAVARLVVPRLADWCAIQLLDGDRLETVALTHVDPARVAWAQQVSAKYPDDMSAPTGAPNVIRTGRSELYPYIPPELIAAAAVDDEHLRLIEEFGLSSGLVVPLVGRSGVIGALSLIYAESGRRYDESDVPFAEDLARRAALAVETAHAFHEQSGRLATVTRVAEAAQHAILATLPPRLGSVALSARYVSAAAEALVGGDLYEVVDRDGAVRLLVGDVRGKGLDAVRLATVVLGEFRAAAADIDTFADVAAQIDRRLRRYLSDEDFVTAVLAEIGDDGRFSLVSCGHPPALISRQGAITELPSAPGLPLGLGAQAEVVTGVLDPGDRLLLYTDGLVEARDPEGGFVDLGAVVEPLSGGRLDEVLDKVLVALRAAVGGALGDDLALVVAEYVG
jgi:serine phosphatase RsbU (regulator of sigma subunit)/anti-sigma regulatory factor (Ser/Thr protein kinase)